MSFESREVIWVAFLICFYSAKNRKMMAYISFYYSWISYFILYFRSDSYAAMALKYR